MFLDLDWPAIWERHSQTIHLASYNECGGDAIIDDQSVINASGDQWSIMKIYDWSYTIMGKADTVLIKIFYIHNIADSAHKL